MKNEPNRTKYRHELKYILTKLQFEELKARLSSFLLTDKNTQEDGTYFIRSLYFDNYLNKSYYQVLDGISKREKYRIRYYNNNFDYICLEKKDKINNMTNKTSCKVTKTQVEDLINHNLEIDKNNPKLLNEFILKNNFYGYKPVIIIDYNRIPFVYDAGNVRITLDYNISMNHNTSDFFKKDTLNIPLLEKDLCLLEIKYDDFLPSYISWLCNINQLFQTSYSKYLQGRLMQNKIINKEAFYEQF